MFAVLCRRQGKFQIGKCEVKKKKHKQLQLSKWSDEASISKERASFKGEPDLGTLGLEQKTRRVGMFHPQSHCPSLGGLFLWHPLDLLFKLMLEMTLLEELRYSAIHWVLSAQKRCSHSKALSCCRACVQQNPFAPSPPSFPSPPETFFSLEHP